MSIPIPARSGKVKQSAPIPIASRKPAVTARPPVDSYLSASVPAAPIIGSLKAPTQLESMIPDLSLPPASPEAFSLVCRSGQAVTYNEFAHLPFLHTFHTLHTLAVISVLQCFTSRYVYSLRCCMQAAVNTEKLSERMIGVSSAPARTFIEHARRSR